MFTVLIVSLNHAFVSRAADDTDDVIPVPSSTSQEGETSQSQTDETTTLLDTEISLSPDENQDESNAGCSRHAEMLERLSDSSDRPISTFILIRKLWDRCKSNKIEADENISIDDLSKFLELRRFKLEKCSPKAMVERKRYTIDKKHSGYKSLVNYIEHYNATQDKICWQIFESLLNWNLREMSEGLKALSSRFEEKIRTRTPMVKLEYRLPNYERLADGFTHFFLGNKERVRNLEQRITRQNITRRVIKKWALSSIWIMCQFLEDAVGDFIDYYDHILPEGDEKRESINLKPQTRSYMARARLCRFLHKDVDIYDYIRIKIGFILNIPTVEIIQRKPTSRNEAQKEIDDQNDAYDDGDDGDDDDDNDYNESYNEGESGEKSSDNNNNNNNQDESKEEPQRPARFGSMMTFSFPTEYDSTYDKLYGDIELKQSRGYDGLVERLMTRGVSESIPNLQTSLINVERSHKWGRKPFNSIGGEDWWKFNWVRHLKLADCNVDRLIEQAEFVKNCKFRESPNLSVFLDYLLNRNVRACINQHEIILSANLDDLPLSLKQKISYLTESMKSFTLNPASKIHPSSKRLVNAVAKYVWKQMNHILKPEFSATGSVTRTSIAYSIRKSIVEDCSLIRVAVNDFILFYDNLPETLQVPSSMSERTKIWATKDRICQSVIGGGRFYHHLIAVLLQRANSFM